MKLKVGLGAVASGAILMMTAGPAFAHECTNASKDAHNPTAGAQLIFGDPVNCPGQDEILGGKPHALALLESGGFPSGWIAFDVTCDGVADAGTYIVGPGGEVPRTAQLNGSTTHGVMSLCQFLGLPEGCLDD